MIKLNLARNCLRYLIRVYGIKEIYLPYYSCKVLWSAVKKENCDIKFYHIGSDFLPTVEFDKNSFILYINYYGLCDSNCRKLEKMYPNLIIDNTQAFYSEEIGLAAFNSLRKFSPVQNGAYLYTEKFLDTKFEDDAELFTPVTMREDYEKFVQNEKILDTQGIKNICAKTENYIKNIDFKTDKKIRLERFWEYHKMYNKYNNIKLVPTEKEVPYCYPLSTTDKNIQKEISGFGYPLLSLWGEIPKDFPEYEFLNNTVALPLR